MTLSAEAKKISYVQMNILSPDGGNIAFVADGKECRAAFSDVAAEAESLLNALPGLRSLEQKEIATLKEEKEAAFAEAAEERKKAGMAEEKTRIAEANLKRAQDQIAKLVTGNPNAKMTPETARLFAELNDGISIDAGDYYRMPGGLVLYRAKRDMSPYVAAEMSPEGKNGSSYWAGGGNDKQPDPKPGVKYPKGTEKEYMGAMYYACVDTNEEPSAGYPTWDLLENKPKD